MAVPLLTPLFKSLSNYRELSAMASMLGVCQAGVKMIGEKQCNERRIISFLDQIASTSPGSDEIEELLQRIPRYLNNYAVTNSSLMAVSLACKLSGRMESGVFRSYLFYKPSADLVIKTLARFIEQKAHDEVVGRNFTLSRS